MLRWLAWVGKEANWCFGVDQHDMVETAEYRKCLICVVRNALDRKATATTCQTRIHEVGHNRSACCRGNPPG